MAALGLERLGDVERGSGDHQAAEDDEGPEDRAPVGDGEYQSAHDRRDHRRKTADGLHHGHHLREHRSPCDIDDHGAGDRGCDAAAEALYDACGDQPVDRRRESAPDGAQHADGTADEDRYAAPALI